MQIASKTWIVTGAGNGMGRELVLQLLKKGAGVAAIDINANALEETQKLSGGSSRLSLHLCSVADREAVEKLPAEVLAAHGSIDGIINNAGIIQPFVKINELEYGVMERVMNINYWGVVYMTKTFLPFLMKQPEGHIVNISSMGGFLPVPGQSVYGASKAAVKLFTEGLYAELRHTHVKVTLIYPGAISTDIVKNSGVQPMDPEAIKKGEKKMKPLSAKRAAEIMISSIEKNKTRIWVGKDSAFLDTLYRMSPGFATNFIAKQMEKLLMK